MFGRPRETSPARVALYALGALALMFLSWIIAGAFVGDAGRSAVPDRAAVARSAVAQAPEVPEDGSDTPAPEVDNSNVDSYAAYQSKDPFRQLIAPASADAGGATTGTGTTTGPGTAPGASTGTTAGSGDAGPSSGTSGPGAGGSGAGGPAGTVGGENDGSGVGAGTDPTTDDLGDGAGGGSGPLAGETVTITRRDQRDRPVAAVVRDAGANYAVSDGATITVRDTGGNRARVTDGRGAEVTAESGAVVIRKSPDVVAPIRALDRLEGSLTVVGSTGITREGAGQNTNGGAAEDQHDGGGTGSGGGSGLFDSGGDLRVLPDTYR